MDLSDEIVVNNQTPQNIFLETNPEFCRAVGISNEFVVIEDINQNKAIGSESEIISMSPGNTVTSSSRERTREQESDHRGGSTMSDLHNTEYMDESKASKSRMSPGTKLSSPHSPNSRQGSRTPRSNGSGTGERPGSVRDRPSKSRSPAKTESIPERSSVGTYNRSDLDNSDENTARQYQTLVEPDPSAERDLDNASPETMSICDRHPCHYCIFVYFPSSSVDDYLQPFRRKVFMDKLSQLQDPDLVKEVRETRCARDAYADRRIKSIERRSGTEIRLGELDLDFSFIKGLPRRRLTIAGPSFAHIGCALSLMEDLLPFVVKSAVFPYRLPSGSSTRYHTSSKNSSMFNWEQRRLNGSVTLRSNLDDKGGWRNFIAGDEKV